MISQVFLSMLWGLKWGVLLFLMIKNVPTNFAGAFWIFTPLLNMFCGVVTKLGWCLLMLLPVTAWRP